MKLHRGDRPAFTRCLLDYNGSPGGVTEGRGGSGFSTHAIGGVPRRASSRALVLVRTPSIANEAGKYSEAVNMDWAHHEASPAFDVIVVQIRAGPGRVSLDLVAGVKRLGACGGRRGIGRPLVGRRIERRPRVLGHRHVHIDDIRRLRAVRVHGARGRLLRRCKTLHAAQQSSGSLIFSSCKDRLCMVFLIPLPSAVKI